MKDSITLDNNGQRRGQGAGVAGGGAGEHGGGATGAGDIAPGRLQRLKRAFLVGGPRALAYGNRGRMKREWQAGVGPARAHTVRALDERQPGWVSTGSRHCCIRTDGLSSSPWRDSFPGSASIGVFASSGFRRWSMAAQTMRYASRRIRERYAPPTNAASHAATMTAPIAGST